MQISGRIRHCREAAELITKNYFSVIINSQSSQSQMATNKFTACGLVLITRLRRTLLCRHDKENRYTCVNEEESKSKNIESDLWWADDGARELRLMITQIKLNKQSQDRANNFLDHQKIFALETETSPETTHKLPVFFLLSVSTEEIFTQSIFLAHRSDEQGQLIHW